MPRMLAVSTNRGTVEVLAMDRYVLPRGVPAPLLLSHRPLTPRTLVVASRILTRSLRAAASSRPTQCQFGGRRVVAQGWAAQGGRRADVGVSWSTGLSSGCSRRTLVCRLCSSRWASSRSCSTPTSSSQYLSSCSGSSRLPSGSRSCGSRLVLLDVRLEQPAWF